MAQEVKKNRSSMIWKVAEDNRGVYQKYELSDIIIPFMLITRLDSFLEDTKEDVLAEYEELKKSGADLNSDFAERALMNAASTPDKEIKFYNVSQLSFKELPYDSQNIVENFNEYIRGFSKDVQDILSKFDFNKAIESLSKSSSLLSLIVGILAIDLSPKTVSNHEMGTIFEELLRRFAEI